MGRVGDVLPVDLDTDGDWIPMETGISLSASPAGVNQRFNPTMKDLSGEGSLKGA